jgi:hypothetical protein
MGVHEFDVRVSLEFFLPLGPLQKFIIRTRTVHLVQIVPDR